MNRHWQGHHRHGQPFRHHPAYPPHVQPQTQVQPGFSMPPNHQAPVAPQTQPGFQTPAGVQTPPRQPAQQAYQPQPGSQQNWPHQQNVNRQISIYDAMAAANEQVPGDIVKVELEQEKGVWVYEVEIVTQEGTQYEIDVDANTGEVLSVELD